MSDEGFRPVISWTLVLIHTSGLMACLLKNEPASCSVSRRAKHLRCGVEAKASLKRAAVAPKRPETA